MRDILQFFLKHSSLYRKVIHYFFGIKDVHHLSIPFDIYGDFSVNYLGYNKKGLVIKGFKTLRQAIKNKGNLGLTVLYNRD